MISRDIDFDISEKEMLYVGCIYRIFVFCGEHRRRAIYIGETSDPIWRRMERHNQSIRSGEHNPLYEAIRQSPVCDGYICQNMGSDCWGAYYEEVESFYASVPMIEASQYECKQKKISENNEWKHIRKMAERYWIHHATQYGYCLLNDTMGDYSKGYYAWHEGKGYRSMLDGSWTTKYYLAFNFIRPVHRADEPVDWRPIKLLERGWYDKPKQENRE